MQLAEDLTKEYFFDFDECDEKLAYKAARHNACHWEMTGISIASEGLFKGATNMSSSGFGQGFSDIINNRISSVLSNTAQTAINSSLNSQPLNLDLGSMALSAYSNSIGAQIS